MVWGCFSGEKGRGDQYFLPKNKKMTAELYLQVLEEHMLNFYHIHGSVVFMHDSALCHKARKITRYLEQKQISVLEWPGNSPNLNLFENCWHKMKKEMSEKKTSYLEILLEELKKLWCQEMLSTYLKNLSDSMPKRLQMVIKNKGNMSKYLKMWVLFSLKQQNQQNLHFCQKHGQISSHFMAAVDGQEICS